MGLVGFQVADRLIEEGKNVTIIENDDVAARYASSRLDCIVITGMGNNLDVLRKAGAEHAENVFFDQLTAAGIRHSRGKYERNKRKTPEIGVAKQKPMRKWVEVFDIHLFCGVL